MPLTFSAQVKTTTGGDDPHAAIRWSFGDGSTNTGTKVTKTYHYPGTYRVVAVVTDGTVKVEGKKTVMVRAAGVRIDSVSGTGVTLLNTASTTLELSGWHVTAGVRSFRIPDGMELLPHTPVLLPFSIMNVPVSYQVALLFPDGRVADQYTPPAAAAAQPSALPVRSTRMKAVENFTSQKNPVQKNEEAVVAPTAASRLAAVGAAFATATAPHMPAEGTKSPATGLLHSLWLLGLAGVVVVAGGAFILL